MELPGQTDIPVLVQRHDGGFTGESIVLLAKRLGFELVPPSLGDINVVAARCTDRNGIVKLLSLMQPLAQKYRPVFQVPQNKRQ